MSEKKNQTIGCPKCGGIMPKTFKRCPHFGCYAYILEEMEYLRIIINSATASEEEKTKAREKLDELEAAYGEE